MDNKMTEIVQNLEINENPNRCGLKSNVIKYLKTGNLYLSFLGLGLCVAVAGPTLLDLASNVGVGTQEITSIYASRSSGYLAGALIGGVLFDRFHRQMLYIIMMLICCVTSFAIPWCRNLILLAFCMLISGFGLGAMDTGGNVWCLNIWTKESGPYMQALHFLFGLGALLGPLIAEPFLRPLERDSDASHKNSTLLRQESSSVNRTLLNESVFSSAPGDLDDGYYIITAYAIISGFILVVTLSIVTLFIIAPADPEQAIAKEKSSGANKASKFNVAFICLCFCFYAVYGGMEVAFGQLLTTFAVEGKLALSKSTGSFMTSAFWGCFSLGRGLSIFWATKFSPFSMLMADFITINLSSLALVLFSEMRIEVLWIGICFNGLGMASVYASFMAWVEQYFVISNKVASVFVVAPSLGEMVLPLFIGFFIETIPMMLMYVTLGCAVFCGAVFFSLHRMTRSRRDFNASNEIKSRTEKGDLELADPKENERLDTPEKY